MCYNFAHKLTYLHREIPNIHCPFLIDKTVLHRCGGKERNWQHYKELTFLFVSICYYDHIPALCGSLTHTQHLGTSLVFPSAPANIAGTQPISLAALLSGRGEKAIALSRLPFRRLTIS